jgi:putative ABC transport system permease protein
MPSQHTPLARPLEDTVGPAMHDIWRDILISARVFRRSPALAASVAITIGLGVGASLAILGLLHDTLIGKSPFRNPDGLVVIENTGRYYYEGRVSEGLASPLVSASDWADIEAQSRTLSAIGAVAHISGVMTGGDRPRPIWRTLVSRRFFAAIGARPRLGRLLDETDFDPSAMPVAVLTESMWRRHFSSDADAIGQMIRIDDQAFTVVGVVQDAVLRFLRQPGGLLDQVQDRQVISPMLPTMVGGEAQLFKYLQQQRDAPGFSVVGRLAPGETPLTAQSEISVIAGRLAAEHPSTNRRRGLQARSLEEWRTTKVRGTTMMLLVAALLMFLVSSFNASGLILAESVRHATETAVREALGAGYGRLVRFECLRGIVLAVPGGLLALALAGLALLVVDRTLADGSGAILRTLLASRVILAGIVITTVAGLIAGASAAWTVRRRGVVEALKQGGLTTSAGRRRQLALRGLVALQVGAATALVLGAGLMLRSVWNIVSVDLGFDVGHSLVIQVRLPPARYATGASQREFFQQALRRIRALPGVGSAGVAGAAPLTGTSMVISGVTIQLPSGQTHTPERVNAQAVTPGYLEALDMKLQRGRWFGDRDYATAEAVLVDQAFCRKYLPDVDPLQARVQLGRASLPIVGIVGDVRRDGPLEEPVDMLYLMERFDRPAKWSFLVVRTTGRSTDIGPTVLREVLALDPEVGTEDPQTVSDLFADTFATRRRLLVLLVSAACIVVLLTAFSLVSTLGHFIAARRREIAIRLALGAQKRHVALLLGRHVIIALGLGLTTGAGTGLVLARTLSTELFGITPTDPRTFIASLAALALLATLAAVAPLWRATGIDPTIALRSS